jgi:tRNA (guanine37-N1)-methyltransferase
MIVIDSVVRLLPGVLGGETSTEIESFQDDDENIEFPQYTRPEVFRELRVPEVLLNGHHAEIAKWRANHSHKAEN